MLNLIFPSLRDCIVESEISGTNMLSAVANMLPAENPEPDEDILVQEMHDLHIPDTLDNSDAPTLIEAFERVHGGMMGHPNIKDTLTEMQKILDWEHPKQLRQEVIRLIGKCPSCTK